VNKGCDCGPYLDEKKVKTLPDSFGPLNATELAVEIVDKLVSCALDVTTTHRKLLHCGACRRWEHDRELTYFIVEQVSLPVLTKFVPLVMKSDRYQACYMYYGFENCSFC
jgi:hypothetical protein